MEVNLLRYYNHAEHGVVQAIMKYINHPVTEEKGDFVKVKLLSGKKLMATVRLETITPVDSDFVLPQDEIPDWKK